MPPERIFTNSLLKRLKKIGFFFKISDKFTSFIPDILGISKGKFIAIEVKAKGKKPSAGQLWFMSQINKHGGHAFWCDNLETFNENLYRIFL